MANYFNVRLCEHCGTRTATKRIVMTVQGVGYEAYVCDECALAYMNGAGGFVGANEDIVCPSCGTRLSDLEDSAYLGCSDCYEVFRQETLSKIQALHNTRKHTGKRLPKTATQRKVNLTDRESMTEQFFLAKEEGRLDDEAEIRDEYLDGGDYDD
jgi:Uncharacterized protein with conserved CXXC pairs